MKKSKNSKTEKRKNKHGYLILKNKIRQQDHKGNI